MTGFCMIKCQCVHSGSDLSYFKPQFSHSFMVSSVIDWIKTRVIRKLSTIPLNEKKENLMYE